MGKTMRRLRGRSTTRRNTIMGGSPCDACGKNAKKPYDVDGNHLCSACYKKQQKDLSSRPDLAQIEKDIVLFKTAGVGRGSNDDLNKRREKVLLFLYNPPPEFQKDPYWVEMSTKWREMIRKMYDGPYDDVKIVLKAGRGFNHDMEIVFMKSKVPVHTVKAEFKHNAKSIDNLPEYFSPAANKPYFDVNYGDYFYDKYLDRVCNLSEEARRLKPTKPNYTKVLYQNVYTKDPLFTCLKNQEVDPVFYREKQDLVRMSIKDYLNTYASTLKRNLLSKDMLDRQSGKIFILWDLNNFRIDSIRDEEMMIVSAEEIKNNNTLIAVSKAGTKHEMLLRWKNHLGVLYPAWQISLTRSK